LRTSCWLLPQKLQYSVFLLSLELLAISSLSGLNALSGLGRVFRIAPD